MSASGSRTIYVLSQLLPWWTHSPCVGLVHRERYVRKWLWLSVFLWSKRRNPMQIDGWENGRKIRVFNASRTKASGSLGFPTCKVFKPLKKVLHKFHKTQDVC